MQEKRGKQSGRVRGTPTGLPLRPDQSSNVPEVASAPPMAAPVPSPPARPTQAPSEASCSCRGERTGQALLRKAMMRATLTRDCQCCFIHHAAESYSLPTIQLRNSIAHSSSSRKSFSLGNPPSPRQRTDPRPLQ